ncbi:MAG: T9SS type A sorting domain-containing protein, partial [Saprospiraceae bacterium]
DVLGKKAMFQEIPNSSKELLQIDISNLSPGVYSVTIEAEDKLLTQKFIKL